MKIKRRTQISSIIYDIYISQPVIGTPGIGVSVQKEQESGITAGSGQVTAKKTPDSTTGASKPPDSSSGASKATSSTSQPSINQTMVGPGLLPMTKVPQISSSQAAANWLKSAQDETTNQQGQSDAVQKAAVCITDPTTDLLAKITTLSLELYFLRK